MDGAGRRPRPRTRPSTLDGQAHVGDFLLEATEDDCRIGTRRRRRPAPTCTSCGTSSATRSTGWVSYRAIATTRFREYFPPEITTTRRSITHEGAEVAAERAVVAAAGPARGALRRAHMDVGRARSAAGRSRSVRDGRRQHSRARDPAAGCASTSTGRGTRPAPTSCSASCSRTSRGSPGRSTSQAG